MEDSHYNHTESPSVPLLDTRMEERLLASGLVSEIRKSPGHYSFTMSDNGMMALAKAMHSVVFEESLSNNQPPLQRMFPDRSDDMITKKDVMDGFGITHTTLWKWEKKGYLTPVRVGRKVYYKREDIQKLTK